MVFYTCVLAAVCLFLLWGSESYGCESNPAILAKMEKKLTKKIYAIELTKENVDFSDSGVESLWAESAKKAHMIIVDNFACKPFELFKS